MEIGIDLFATLRVAVALAAFSTFAWALLRMRRENAEQLDRLHAAQLELAKQVQVLAERTGALATLVAVLPKQAERAPEAPAPQSRREAQPVRSYETARRLARAGASIDEIVASSGLAASEARLLSRLHGGELGQGDAA
ncbi:MAG TPA: DUF2802 domain-containing protein [Steroidobacteraceae bacterium]|nr:DUF2802 domain-containing protein [Steroidobacteraceae bacterium]